MKREEPKKERYLVGIHRTLEEAGVGSFVVQLFASHGSEFEGRHLDGSGGTHRSQLSAAQVPLGSLQVQVTDYDLFPI